MAKFVTFTDIDGLVTRINPVDVVSLYPKPSNPLLTVVRLNDNSTFISNQSVAALQTLFSVSDSYYDYPEDSSHVSGDRGAFILAVRNDAGTPLASDGEYIPFTTDATGAIRVSSTGGSSVTQTGRDDTDNQAPVATGLLTSVDRTYVWDSVGGNWDRWTGAVTQGTSPWVIGDGGSSITVDAVDLDIRNLVFATDKVDVSGSTIALDAGTLAALETITVLQGTSPWVIGDGGGSITVDGTISISGTVTTDSSELPTASALADNDPNPTTTRIGANNLIWDGANWDRWTGAVTQGTSPWVIGDGGGSITVDGTVTVTQGTSPWVTSLDAATLAALESITVQNGAGAAAVNIQDGGNSITVDGTVAVTMAGGSLANGAATAVAAAAVQVLAANANRKKLIVQNTGTANVRVGITGVTNTTGIRLLPNGTLMFDMPDCPTNAIFAIREGATSSTVNATEVT